MFVLSFFFAKICNLSPNLFCYHFSSSYGWKVDILDVRKANLVIKFLEYKCGEDFDFERLNWWL